MGIVGVFFVALVIYIIIAIANGMTFENVMILGGFFTMLLFAYIVKKCHFDVMKVLPQYFRDEAGMYVL